MAPPFPDPNTLRAIVELAVSAPSIHNTQPWRWRVEAGRALHLSADFSRQLMYADPKRRALFVSCGAALHTAEVAAAAQGWSTTVDRDPEPASGHVAAITFWPGTPTPEESALADAARRRRTDRRQVTSWPVPEGWFARLRRIAAELQVRATGDFDEAQRRVVTRQLADAARAESMNDAYLDELMAWSGRARDDGIPAANLPDRAAAGRLGDSDSATRFPAGELSDEANDEGAEDAQWLLLSTAEDDPASWVRTGEALSAVWLFCTLEGLSVVPYTQPVEVDAARASLRAELLEDASHPQVLLRVGWPPVARTPPPQTPRRPVDEVLDL